MNHQMNNQKNNNNDDLVLQNEEFLVCLDSRNATTYNNGSMNSNVLFQLEDSIRKNHESIDMSFSVLNFTSPYSFYQLNTTNNFLAMYISSVLVNIYFDEGNYDVNSFIQAFNTKLSSFSVTLSYNSLNNRFTLLSPNYFTINNNSTIYNVMGFIKNRNMNCSYSITAGFYAFECSYSCNFSGLNNLNIRLLNMNTKNVDSLSSTVSNIVQSIPVNANPLGTIFFEKKIDYSFNMNVDCLDSIQIGITDDLQNYIDFNGNHWNMTLLFRIRQTCHFNKQTFNDIIEKNSFLYY